MTVEDSEMLTALLESGIEDDDVREGMARLFLQSLVVVPSRTDPGQPGGFAPLVSNEPGVPCVLALTTSRALPRVQDIAPFALQMTGEALVSWLAPGTGIRMDTGHRSGFLLPEYLDHLRQSLADGGDKE